MIIIYEQLKQIAPKTYETYKNIYRFCLNKDGRSRYCHSITNIGIVSMESSVVTKVISLIRVVSRP